MDDVFKKIGSKITLSQKIERRLEAAIREKKLPIGSKLPTERELCESFGVSRTALREALRRLSARGLIVITKGSGMKVTGIKIEEAISTLNLYYDLQFDRNLIAQIIEVRKIFEPEIGRLASTQRNDEDILELSNNLILFKNCDPDNTQLESDLDNKFHLLMVKATHNPIIQVTMEPIYTLLPRMRNLIYANIDGEKEITYKYHAEMLEAVKLKDQEGIVLATQRHLERSGDNYYKYLHQYL